MPSKASTVVSVATATVICLAASTAIAQTGAALMVKPFAEGQAVEVGSEAIYIDSVGADGAEGYMGVYDGYARWRLTGEDQRNVTFGAEVTYIDFEGPARLVDQSFAVGFNVGEVGPWQVDVVAGLGHAGDNAYTDGQALYAMGDLIFTKGLDETSSLQLFVNYNGNRTAFPDLPLPGIAYNKRVSDELSYTLGLPFNSVTWRPADNVCVNVDYGAPTSFSVRVECDVHDAVSVFAAASNRVDAFAVDGDVDNRRIFFEQYRAEAGLRWEPCANFGVEIAGGYAFEQRLRRGFDTRSYDTLVGLSDEPYVKVAANIGF